MNPRRAGKYNALVQAFRASRAQDDYGQPIETWAPLSAPFFASFREAKAEDRVSGENTEYTLETLELFADAYDLVGIKSDDRIKLNGKLFDIVSLHTQGLDARGPVRITIVAREGIV